MFRSLLCLLLIGFSVAAEARDVRVRGYYRKDGTYVAPHIRSSPNNTTLDNYGRTTKPRSYPIYPLISTPTPPPPPPINSLLSAPIVKPKLSRIFGNAPNVRCSEWTKDIDGPVHNQGLEWLFGFYSAYSVYASEIEDFTAGGRAQALYDTTLGYCLRNPDDTLNYAASGVVRMYKDYPGE